MNYGNVFRSLAFVAMLSAALPAWADSSLDTLFIMCRLQDNGDAHITEKRVMYIDEEGSELYIPIGNLDGSEIKDLKVFDEDGEDFYQNIGRWNSDATRQEKTRKCGIIDKGDGSCEICWGIGHTGPHVYYTQYTITNLVRSYSDYDGMNHMFVNPGIYPAPDNVLISISHEKFALEEDNVRGWAFGFKGNVEVRNDRVVVESEGPFDDDDYCVVLCRFEQGMMHPALITDDSFDTLKEKAFEGSDYGVEEKSFGDKVGEIIALIFTALGGLLGLGGMVFGAKSFISGCRKEKKLRNELTQDLTWWRKPVYGLQKSNSILCGLSFLSGLNTKNLLSAYVLKMLYMGWLKVVDERLNATLAGSPDKDKKMFLAIGEREDVGAQRVASEGGRGQLLDNDGILLEQLYNIFQQAAGDDRVLQPKELTKYMDDHKAELVSFVERLRKTTVSSDVKQSDKEGIRQLLGFKKFLEEFTLSNEHHAYEVNLWKDYLIYATLFGCGEQVRKDMKQINPEFFRMDNITRQLEQSSDMLPLFTTAVASGTNRVANYIDRQKAEKQQAHRSSGFGGFSSFGGGGGHTGGGHGGGIR